MGPPLLVWKLLRLTGYRPSDSRVPLLAVMLGRFYGVYYYFTYGGQLMADTGIPSVLFSVADFASPPEMQPLVDFIPKDRYLTPTEIRIEHQPPMELGINLERKITSFSNEASGLYQRAMSSLSAASKKLPWTSQFRTLSLHEIATILVPDMADANGNFEPALMYAIHTALLDDETDAFRALNQISSGKHVSYLYRVSPAASIDAILNVRSLMRDIMETFGGKFPFQKAGRPSSISNPLWWFIVKARNTIKTSRENRSFTDHGVLTPHHERYPACEPWSSSHKSFIRFIELWASNHFRRGSPLHSLGSSILRLTGMYGEARQLNESTGWTFLQEIGWIPSWEISTRFRFPLAGASVQPGGGYNRPNPGQYTMSMRDDIAAGYRKDWGSLKAYCIDAPSTTLLDDAISIEPTETPGEHWIHVHSADPSAFVKPHSKLAEFAGIMAMDHFLPGYRYSMFPEDFYDDVIMKKLSLASGRPCLTFSTRVNEAGEVLDTKIQPGTLQNVMFISPDDIAKSCPPLRKGSMDVSGPTSLYVGPSQEADPEPTRKMITADDLSPQETANLQTMHRILAAVDAARFKRGAVRQSRPARSVRVMFDGKGHSTPEPSAPEVAMWPGDPAIELSLHPQEDGSLVSMAMTLAGETAAKWCHARGIPVPYHTQPGALRNRAMMQGLTEKIHGYMDRGEPVPMSLWQVFDREAGPSAQAVDPSPVILMGMDMYTKVTSPLRRLADCITHWQIHAYLASNPPSATTTSSTTPTAADEATLPWSRKALASKLDSLRLSTHTSRSLSRLGTQPWAHQAFLRAWRFGEAAIPPTFTFTARDVYAYLVQGDIDFLGFRAVLPKTALNGVALIKEVRPGDRFEVSVANVDAYRCIIYLNALRTLGAEEVVGSTPEALAV